MRLYLHHRGSPPVRKVRAVAAQAGLTLEEIEVDWAGGAHREPGYLALNPNAKFPTLVDGDFVLWEANAICQYLAAMAPGAGLLPADERGRAEVARWSSWEQAHLSPAAQCMYGLRHGGEEAARVAAEAEFRRWAAVLDGQLRGRTFLVGERLSVADFCVAGMIMFRQWLPLDGYRAIGRWFEAVAATPGWRASEPPGDVS